MSRYRRSANYNWWNWTPRPKQQKGSSSEPLWVYFVLLLIACVIAPLAIPLWILLMIGLVVEAVKKRRFRVELDKQFPPLPPSASPRK
jgi:hypothetical protein